MNISVHFTVQTWGMNTLFIYSFILSLIPQTSGDGDNKRNLVDAVCHILGVKDPSSINPESSLGELGLDSLMGVEVKQTLERDYEVSNCLLVFLSLCLSVCLSATTCLSAYRS